MIHKYDGWVARDKDGDFWGNTFRATKREVESYIEDMKDDKEFELRAIKVKLVEVNEGS